MAAHFSTGSCPCRLSRLSRAHPQKHDVFVLDFMNDTDTIQNAMATHSLQQGSIPRW
jgi:hypothetical protein